MIDVHAPHESTHSWTDFFIHIGTIILGILIALGLEQALESLHQDHQLHDLRGRAMTDARIYLHDVDENLAANTRQIEDLSTRIRQVQDTIAQHRPLPPPAYRPALNIDTIRLGNLAAAQASGLTNLLTPDEINSNADAEVAVIKSEALKERAQEAATQRIAFEQRFQTLFPGGPFDFSPITPAQLDQYLGLLLNERVRRVDTVAYLNLMHYGALAYLSGQRNLQKLREDEQDLAH